MMVDEYIGPAPEQPPQIEYTWEILNLQTQSSGNTSGIIVHIDWKKIGTLNGVSASYTGSSSFPITSIDTSATYTPIDQVTEDDVIRWVRATIAGAFETVVDMNIAKQISEIQSPKQSIPLPWVKTNTEGNL